MTTRRSILRGLLGALAAPVVAKTVTETSPAVAAPAPAPVDASGLEAINADLGDVIADGEV